MRRTEIIRNAKRVVVKIGSAVLFDRGREIDRQAVQSLSSDVAELVRAGREVVIVSSGAIACGAWRLGLEKRPETLPELQAAASIGQHLLMSIYEEAFSKSGLHVGQMLLTRDDFDNRVRYLNARNTLRALLAAGAVPIVNENDTVAVEEIRFGENDYLSAQVANLFEADVLVMLSTVDGLHEDYRTDGKSGPVIPEVEGVDERITALATGDKSATGAGGMATKLEAARMLTGSGAAALIASGKVRGVIRKIFDGEKLGTLFFPTRSHLAGRKRWIGYGARARGEVVVDEGAARALLEKGKSLLPSGIVSVSGKFGAGDVVSVRTERGEAFARGVASYSSQDVDLIKGVRTSQIASILGSHPYDEVIHRDNMTLL